MRKINNIYKFLSTIYSVSENVKVKKRDFYLYARCNWSRLLKWCYKFLSAGHTDTSRHIDTPERRTDRTNPEGTLIKRNERNKIICLFYHEWGHVYKNNREIKAKCLNMKAKRRIMNNKGACFLTLRFYLNFQHIIFMYRTFTCCPVHPTPYRCNIQQFTLHLSVVVILWLSRQPGL